METDVTCIAEFTIEPFEEGNPGPHVTEAIAAVTNSGVKVNMGPFGTTVEGSLTEVAHAVEAALQTSLTEGATRVTVTVTQTANDAEPVQEHPVLEAFQPVLQAVGGEFVAKSRLSRLDFPIEWEGEVIGGIRLQSLEGAVSRMAIQIADEEEHDLSSLSREEKQRVVHDLNDRGAFAIRGAIEEVADLMGVSRITVYNYLNSIKS